jgi:hypothetical protein
MRAKTRTLLCKSVAKDTELDRYFVEARFFSMNLLTSIALSYISSAIQQIHCSLKTKNLLKINLMQESHDAYANYS